MALPSNMERVINGRKRGDEDAGAEADGRAACVIHVCLRRDG